MYPRRNKGCGYGCLSGLTSMILAPIILIVFLMFMFSAISGNGIDVEIAGSYDEEKFQDYANHQYEEEFAGSSAYEDNLLITVLVEDEEYYNFYYIAWVGDHIAADINYLMGNNDSFLGDAMNSNISATSYKYSLDSDLARVMHQLTQEVQSLNLTDSFTCTENHHQVRSHLTNHSDLEMTESTVNEALNAFTDATGIPVVIVVEDMNAVFGRTTSYESSQSNSFSFVLLLGLAAVIIIIVVIKKQRGSKSTDVYDNVPQNNSTYQDDILE